MKFLKLKSITSLRANLTLRVKGAIVAAICGAAIAVGAVPPTLSLTSNVGVFNFGRLNVGSVSTNTVITFSNSGTTGPIRVSKISIAGANAGDYRLVATTCDNATLASGGSCIAKVKFAPLLVGPRSAMLTVTDSADGSQHLVPLTGAGLYPSLPNKAAGPIDPRIGYPLWYQDELGARLTLCLDTSGFCVPPPPDFDPYRPPSVTAARLISPMKRFIPTPTRGSTGRVEGSFA